MSVHTFLLVDVSLCSLSFIGNVLSTFAKDDVADRAGSTIGAFVSLFMALWASQLLGWL